MKDTALTMPLADSGDRTGFEDSPTSRQANNTGWPVSAAAVVGGLITSCLLMCGEMLAYTSSSKTKADINEMDKNHGWFVPVVLVGDFVAALFVGLMIYCCSNKPAKAAEVERSSVASTSVTTFGSKKTNKLAIPGAALKAPDSPALNTTGSLNAPTQTTTTGSIVAPARVGTATSRTGGSKARV